MAPGQPPRRSRRPIILRDRAQPEDDRSPGDTRVQERLMLQRRASFPCAIRYYEKNSIVNDDTNVPFRLGVWRGPKARSGFGYGPELSTRCATVRSKLD